MMWALVVVALLDGHGPESLLEGVYADMYECFEQRDAVIYDLFGDPNGSPPANYQVVCIATDKY